MNEHYYSLLPLEAHYNQAARSLQRRGLWTSSTASYQFTSFVRACGPAFPTQVPPKTCDYCSRPVVRDRLGRCRNCGAQH